MRGVDAGNVADHFDTTDEGYRVAKRYRERVRFAQHNLLDPMPPGTAPFDVIMCRNVLIYLTPEAVRRAAEAFSRALVPGGWLILGVSDPIPGVVPGLQQVATKHGLAYRRLDAEPIDVLSGPAADREIRTAVRRARRIRPRAPDPPQSAAAVGRVGQAEVSELVESAERALELGKPREAAALAGEAVERAPRHCPAHRALIQALAEDSRLGDAAAAAVRAMSGFPADALVRNLYAVVLLDEVEKAHPEVFNILLQILEDGHLTDAKGRRVDFRNTIIIMTSNLGAKQLQTNSSLGFRNRGDNETSQAETSYELMKEKVAAELKTNFRPEFLNRIDEIIFFHALGLEHMKRIIDIQIAGLTRRLEERKIHVTLTGAGTLLGPLAGPAVALLEHADQPGTAGREAAGVPVRRVAALPNHPLDELARLGGDFRRRRGAARDRGCTPPR